MSKMFKYVDGKFKTINEAILNDDEIAQLIRAVEAGEDNTDNTENTQDTENNNQQAQDIKQTGAPPKSNPPTQPKTQATPAQTNSAEFEDIADFFIAAGFVNIKQADPLATQIENWCKTNGIDINIRSQLEELYRQKNTALASAKIPDEAEIQKQQDATANYPQSTARKYIEDLKKEKQSLERQLNVKQAGRDDGKSQAQIQQRIKEIDDQLSQVVQEGYTKIRQPKKIIKHFSLVGFK